MMQDAEDKCLRNGKNMVNQSALCELHFNYKDIKHHKTVSDIMIKTSSNDRHKIS